MSPLSLLCVVASCLGIVLLALSLRLNPHAALNRAMAVLAFFYSLWSLGVAVVTSAQVPSTVRFFNWIASIGYLYGAAAYLMTCLVFTGARRRTLFAFLVPVCVVSTIELVQAFSGNWVITGFRPSPWGNVGIRATDNTWPALDLAVHSFIFMVAMVALFRARARSHSRRFRAIAPYWVISLAATAALTAFCVRVIWQKWGYPEPSVLLGMIGVGLDIYLIERYRFLRLDHPNVEQEVIGAMEDAILLLDSKLSVTRANRSAAVLLQRESSELVGADLPSLFTEPAAIRREWAAAVRDREKERKVSCSVDGARLAVALSPIVDVFGDLTGGMAIVRKQDTMDANLIALGITDRERGIILMLMQGFTNKQIADSLFIAPNTVKNHVASIYQKTGARTRVELFRLLQVK